jgi:PTS system ascorbate-specific IIA component
VTDFIKEEHILLRQKVNSWEESIQLASKPLLAEGYFTQKYVESMIDSVHEMGPYIVIAPEVAIAHSRPGNNVEKVGLSLLKLDEHINFSEDGHYASLIFVLSAVDNEAHLDILRQLATKLSDKKRINRLIEAKNSEEIINIFKEND